MSGRAHARETAASAAQYLLLGGFTAVAAGISAQGLTGFARDNMGLRGPWPYLLFLALDGAAGVCAVLLTRRAARAESGLAPRLAVWGLVAASASFNWTHAPHRPGAPEAFGLMPVIGAVLFEFTLRELRQRAAGRADRQMTAVRWLHPAERIRVQRLLAADEHISAQAATRRVRTEQAARRLYQLRRALHARDRAARPGALAARRARIAERRAHAALIRAGFGDPAIAADVLRQVQVLTRTAHLARLDYTTAEACPGCHRQPDHRGRRLARRHRPCRPPLQAARPGASLPTAAVPAAPSLPGQPLPGPGGIRRRKQRPRTASTRLPATTRTATARSSQPLRASWPKPASTASGSARKRSAASSAATATASPTAACAGCWPQPPARPEQAHRPHPARRQADPPPPRTWSTAATRPSPPGCPDTSPGPVPPDRREAGDDPASRRPRTGPGGRAPAEAGRAPHPPARGRPGTAHPRRLGRAAAPGRAHARRGLREHPAHLLPAARRHHGPGLPAMDRDRAAGPPPRERHRDLPHPAPARPQTTARP